jgi:predicted NAD/FAD-dependent oxidoreductase
MNPPTPTTADVLVIGAGMAGLCAAQALKSAGRKPLIVDKGRGIGGRMATRRIGDATFDHGAQFATTRDSRFAEVLESAKAAGAAAEWCRGFTMEADGHPRWRGVPGMASLAKYLAVGLEITQQAQVTALEKAADHWIATMGDGQTWTVAGIVLTAPVPQALALLKAGKVELEPAMQDRLSALQYERCLAVMAVLEGPSRVPPPGGLALSEGPIAWIADNQQKGVSATPAVTLHATDAFSVANWERDREEVARELLAAAAEWLGSAVVSFQIHGWRFSKPLQTDPQPCAVVSGHPPLVLAGDAFAGPRVEGSAVSGWAAAAAVEGCLSS